MRAALWTPTTRKLLLLGVLAVQIGFQPLLMGWYARDAKNVTLRVALIELMKALMALIPLVVSGDWSPQLKRWRWHAALQTTAAPALLYVLQNYLNQVAVVALDGVTFNILNQTKIIWTALLVYVLMRKSQSKQQIVALAVLCGAAVLMTTGKHPAKSSKSPSRHNTSVVFVTAAYQALIAAILSALAGTLIQRALQAQHRHTSVVTLELSVLGELTIALWALTSAVNSSFVATPMTTHGPDPSAAQRRLPPQPEMAMTEGLWDGWTVGTFVALLCQAGGGVLVGVVIKYCGNVEKSFAVVVGMIITALLETHYNGKPFGLRGLVAIALVTVSTLLYTLYPANPGAMASKHVNHKKHSMLASDLESWLPPSPPIKRRLSSIEDWYGVRDNESETTTEIEMHASAKHHGEPEVLCV